MQNDTAYDEFDNLAAEKTSKFRPRADTTYLYAWDEESKKSDWRADGYRWRQNGTKPAKCSNGTVITKTYFRVTITQPLIGN